MCKENGTTLGRQWKEIYYTSVGIQKSLMIAQGGFWIKSTVPTQWAGQHFGFLEQSLEPSVKYRYRTSPSQGRESRCEWSSWGSGSLSAGYKMLTEIPKSKQLQTDWALLTSGGVVSPCCCLTISQQILISLSRGTWMSWTSICSTHWTENFSWKEVTGLAQGENVLPPQTVLKEPIRS